MSKKRRTTGHCSPAQPAPRTLPAKKKCKKCKEKDKTIAQLNESVCNLTDELKKCEHAMAAYQRTIQHFQEEIQNQYEDDGFVVRDDQLDETGKRKRQKLNINHLKTTVSDIYKEAKLKKECIVCMEEMTPDTLFVPTCAHLICRTCYETVKSSTNNYCPQCRAVFKDEQADDDDDDDDDPYEGLPDEESEYDEDEDDDDDDEDEDDDDDD